MKFTLVANEQSRDGFKLSWDASSEKEVDIVRELTKLLIEKIERISVEVKNESY